MFHFWVVLLIVLIFSSGDQDKLEENFEDTQAVPEPSLVAGLFIAGFLYYSFRKRKH